MKFIFSRQVLASALFLLFSPSLQAESQLMSEFRLEMNRNISYGDSPLLSDSYFGKKVVPLRNFPLDSKYPTWLEDVKVDLDYKMTPLKPWNFSNPQDVSSIYLNAVVHIKTIKTHFTETQMSGDTPITLDFKADCHDVQLTLKDPKTTFTANITPENRGHKIELVLNKSDIQWPQGAWDVADFKCTGVKGFEAIAKQEIIKSLKTSAQVQDQIFAELKRQILDWEKSINRTVFNTHVVGEDLENFYSYLNPQHLIQGTQDNDFHFNGHFHFHSQNISIQKNQKKLIKFKTPPKASTSSTGAVLTLPIETLSALVGELLRNGNLFSKFTSRDVDGFRDLMESTSNQERVWPDLLNYTVNDLFKFEMQIIDTPVITDIRNDGNNGLIVRTNSKLALHMFAPRRGQYWPYVEWTSPFTVETKVQVKNGKIHVQLGDLHQFDWDYKMIPAYVKTFNPTSTKIDMATIEEALIKDIKGKDFNWSLSDWRLSKQLHYRANGLYNEGQYLRVYWYKITNTAN